MHQWSTLSQNYPASSIRKMAKRAREIGNPIMLTMGEPNFETPDFIKQAAIQGINENQIGRAHV